MLQATQDVPLVGERDELSPRADELPAEPEVGLSAGSVADLVAPPLSAAPVIYAPMLVAPTRRYLPALGPVESPLKRYLFLAVALLVAAAFYYTITSYSSTANPGIDQN